MQRFTGGAVAKLNLLLLAVLVACACPFLASATGPSGETIAELRGHPPSESLWTFLAAIPTSVEAQIFYALCLGCLVGMSGHYLKQWTSGAITGGLFNYLFNQYPVRTASAAIGAMAWSAGEVGSGLFFTTDGAFVGWALVILSGIKNGYAGDSLVNKGDPAPSTTPPTATPTGGTKP